MSEYQERWGVWCQRDDGGAWCLMPDKVTHRTYATREEAQADADATNSRNADWTGRKWEARRYDVAHATDPRDERIKELAAENARLRESMLELLRLAMDPKCTGYVKRDSKGDIGSIRRAGDIIEDAKALLK